MHFFNKKTFFGLLLCETLGADLVPGGIFVTYFVTFITNWLFFFTISEDSLRDVASLKKLLMKALTLFIDAAESYSKVK